MMKLTHSTLVLLVVVTVWFAPSPVRARSSSAPPPSLANADAVAARAAGPRGRRTRSKVARVSPRGRNVRQLPADVMRGVSTAYLSAESSTVKVGLARLGQTVIEFPSSDRVYKVSPAPEEFVKTNQKVFTRNDPVILYPGTGFVVPKGKTASPATILAVQMYSGLIISIHVYPVESLADNATRVVIAYDKEAVVQARRVAGLSVNYDEILRAQKTETADADVNEGPRATATEARNDDHVRARKSRSGERAASQVEARAEVTPPGEGAAGGRESVSPAPGGGRGARHLHTSAQGQGSVPAGPRPAESGIKLVTPHDVEKELLQQAARGEMTATIKRGLKGLTKFTEVKYGLAVAVSRSRELDSHRRIVVVAVRNALREPVRLMPDQPDLAVETLDAGRPTDTTPVTILHKETTIRDGRLAPGEIGYTVVIYATPILGARQTLTARVAQIFAADAPASVDLAVTAR